MPFIISHSAKGSVWKNHKYVKKVLDRYYYPAGYDKGRTIDNAPASIKKGVSTFKNQAADKIDRFREKGSKIDEFELETDDELTKEQINKIANDVLSGKYGNGEKRREALGDYYSEIQKRVNELVRGEAGKARVASSSKPAAKSSNQTSKSTKKSTKPEVSKKKKEKKKEKPVDKTAASTTLAKPDNDYDTIYNVYRKRKYSKKK